MDNVREKLVGLIGDCKWYMPLEELADHLIANGVTVQEWIPVTEPPETIGFYLVAGNLRWGGKPMAREAYWRGDAWLSCDGKCYITRRVTHWMPPPTPPKGE